jgi:hypothetical protein
MRPTHRIYLKTGLARQPEQVESVTAQFFDINIDACIKAEQARWYRVTGAGGHWTYQRLSEINDDGVHQLLGMRMLLRRNRWYANAQDVDLSMAYVNEEPARRVPGRPLVFLAIAAGFALVLAATNQHLFGLPFTWKHYWAWAVGMLLWMSIMELWQRRR